MAGRAKDLIEGGVKYARNPLGIIALFIVSIYLIAGAVLAASASLTQQDRTPLVWMLTVFPFAVLVVFTVLVMFFPLNLYSPQDIGRKLFFEIHRRKQAVADAAGRAVDKWEGDGDVTARRRAEAQRSVKSVVTPEILSATLHAQVLWVDDNPSNNLNERRGLRAMGMEVDLALTTEEALEALDAQPYDAIISDMKRENEPEGELAGYKLLDAVRKKGLDAPFLLYTSEATPAFRKNAQQRGALLQTNRPDELIAGVAKAVARGSR